MARGANNDRRRALCTISTSAVHPDSASTITPNAASTITPKSSTITPKSSTITPNTASVISPAPASTATSTTSINSTIGVVLAAVLLAGLAACSLRGPGPDRFARLPEALTGGVVPGNRLKKLLHVADAEWRRWGAQVVKVPRGDGICAIVVSGACEVIEDGCGQEQTVALCPVVNEFWAHILAASGETFFHDCSQTGLCEHRLPPEAAPFRTPAWSAAFLSTTMHRAGFTPDEFAASPYHANYVVAARDGYSAAYTVVPTPAYVEPGDVVCTTRFAWRQQFTPEEIGLLTANTVTTSPTPMHCDLVVAVDLSQRWARAVGGNVMQSVSMSEIALDAQGRLSPLVNSQRPWLLAMKLRPEVRAGN